ncbi:hypothetical protein HY449_03890 [Candidatus Pacearchaeota archaeon]|nr:hypothetical protein [Candidatus Pacearchaeota archaeon]
MEIEPKLEKIGLSKTEAKTYLSALKLGLAKVSEIGQKAGVKREAAYYILKGLQEKGFIGEMIKSGVKYYSASSPKRILEILEEEKEQKAITIREILPELDSLQKIAITKPKIEFYEGEEGLKTAASIMTQKENQVIYAYVTEKILKFIPYFHPLFRMRRKERKIKLKVITEKTRFTVEEIKKKDKKELRETRFNNEIINSIDSCYYILPEGIIILKANEKEQLGIYIQEPSTAKLQKNIFEQIWNKSKP